MAEDSTADPVEGVAPSAPQQQTMSLGTAAQVTAQVFGGEGGHPVGLRQRRRSAPCQVVQDSPRDVGGDATCTYQQQRRALLGTDEDLAAAQAQDERFDALHDQIGELRTIVEQQHQLGQQQGLEGRQEIADIITDNAGTAATQLAGLKAKMIAEFSDLQRQLDVGNCIPPNRDNIWSCIGLFIGQLIKLIWILNKLFYWTAKILINIFRRGVNWIPLIGPVLDVMVLFSMVVLFILVYCNIVTAATAGVIPAKLIVGKLLYVMKLVVLRLATAAAGVLQHIGKDIHDIADHADVNVTDMVERLQHFAGDIAAEAGDVVAGAARDGVEQAAAAAADAAGGGLLNAAGSAIGSAAEATANAIGSAVNWIGGGLGLCGVDGCLGGGRRRKTRKRRRRRKRTRRKRKKRKNKRKTKRRRRKRRRKEKGRRTKRRIHSRRKSHKGGDTGVTVSQARVVVPPRETAKAATAAAASHSKLKQEGWTAWIMATLRWKKFLVQKKFTEKELQVDWTATATAGANLDKGDEAAWEKFFEFQQKCLKFLLGDIKDKELCRLAIATATNAAAAALELRTKARAEKKEDLFEDDDEALKRAQEAFAAASDGKDEGFILSVITSVVGVAAAAAATAESQQDCETTPCYYNDVAEKAEKYLNDTYSYGRAGDGPAGAAVTQKVNDAVDAALKVWWERPKATLVSKTDAGRKQSSSHRSYYIEPRTVARHVQP